MSKINSTNSRVPNSGYLIFMLLSKMGMMKMPNSAGIIQYTFNHRLDLQ